MSNNPTGYAPVSAEDAVKCIASGNRVFIHSVAAAPQTLIKAMTARAPELRNVEIVHLHTEGDAPYAAAEMAESFHVNAFFVGANVRNALQEGHADYIPVFLSEIPALFRKGVLPLDVPQGMDYFQAWMNSRHPEDQQRMLEATPERAAIEAELNSYQQ